MLRPVHILASALLSILWTGTIRAEEGKVSRFVEILAPLLDPAKLYNLEFMPETLLIARKLLFQL